MASPHAPRQCFRCRCVRVQCVNTFNVIYLFMRHHDLLPDEMKALRRAVEKVLPDVKNLDKYLEPSPGFIFLSSLAGISAVFDFVLFAGVENENRRLILSAWLWGIVDASFDVAVGIFSGNFSFLDGLARSTWKGPSMRPQVSEQVAVLVTYVILRLIFKMVALAGIRDFSAQLELNRYKKWMALDIARQATAGRSGVLLETFRPYPREDLMPKTPSADLVTPLPPHPVPEKALVASSVKPPPPYPVVDVMPNPY
ncbi:hypothetical protein ISCGN_025600 [Ixodes scapularis]